MAILESIVSLGRALTDLVVEGVKTVINIIGVFFGKLTNWFVKTMPKVEKAINAAIVGAEVMVRKTTEGLKEISNYYSREGNQWLKNTVIKKSVVSENDIPPEILAKVANLGMEQEADISAETEAKMLELENSK